MRILVDSNVFISAAGWANSKPRKVLDYIDEHHHMMVCSQTIIESLEVVTRKIPSKIITMAELFVHYHIDYVQTVTLSEEIIRDETDQPILNAAFFNNADIIVTGDKDFLSLNLKKPECLTPSDFMDKYME
ncbi:MAG: putative toxin-antitoxin system toxin component, PIN family [Flexilinea sp.]|nr:putative toxin-antitoxin system toxin component, PIN family [Flexilinea sp.]